VTGPEVDAALRAVLAASSPEWRLRRLSRALTAAAAQAFEAGLLSDPRVAEPLMAGLADVYELVDAAAPGGPMHARVRRPAAEVAPLPPRLRVVEGGAA
jgi:hypothetical protein